MGKDYLHAVQDLKETKMDFLEAAYEEAMERCLAKELVMRSDNNHVGKRTHCCGSDAVRCPRKGVKAYGSKGTASSQRV